jgi:hypothetical protein
MAALEASVAAARAARQANEPEPMMAAARKSTRKASPAGVPVLARAEAEAEIAPVRRRKSA